MEPVAPGPSPDGPAWQRRLAKAAHGALYVLMIAVLVVGFAMVNAKGHDVAFFAWSAPDLVAKDADLGMTLERVHERLAWALAGPVALHVSAAFWHHFGLRDGTLRGVLPPRA